MQKLMTRAEEAKKNQRNQLIIGIILVGLMIFSTAGYSLMDKSGTSGSNSEVTYKGINFVKSNEYWTFTSGGYEFITRYNPDELKDINVFNQLTLSNYKDKPLYFVTDSGQPEQEIARNLNQRFALRIQNACISEKNCLQSLPVKNCSVDNVIIIKDISEGETPNIYQDGNCVYINAPQINQTMYADALLFNILGI